MAMPSNGPERSSPSRWCGPEQATELIGRDKEVEAASRALLHPDQRLLSILGAAGMGKTRLAVAVAETVRDQFDEIVFVDLTKIADPKTLVSLLAMELGIQRLHGAVMDLVTSYLSLRSCLLVLDNFEHVLPAALTVADIVANCPRVHVLVTSREPLHLHCEQRTVLGPLELPNLEQLPAYDELLAVPSVALFVQRARAANMRLEVSEEMLRQIAEICTRLEGLPLALDLAASRLSVLSPAAMLARFDIAASSLRRRTTDSPERHQSIRAALGWSYRFLSETERAAFRRSGVFVGGWTTEAFGDVATPTIDCVSGFDLLVALTEKGLVLPELTPNDEPRFRLLDAIRSFALESLRDVGELEETRAAHAHHYVRLAERETRYLRFGGPFAFSPSAPEADTERGGGLTWTTALDRDLANLQAVLQWTQESGDYVALLRLAVALRRYWWVRGLTEEGAHWLTLALDQNERAEPALRSRALSGLGVMYWQNGESERARVLLEEAVALTRTLDDPPLLTGQLLDLGRVLYYLGRFVDGTDRAEEAVGIASSGEDTWGLAAALALTSAACITGGDYNTAESRLNKSLALFRSVGDLRSTVLVEVALVRAIVLRGGGSRALPYLDNALVLADHLASDVAIGMVLDVAAYGVSGEAAPEACARLLGAADRLHVHGPTRTGLEREIHDAALAAVGTALPPESLAAALQEGRQLTPMEALVEAKSHVDSLMPAAPMGSSPTTNKHLNAREQEVLSLIAAGLRNKEISGLLGISENTVKFHISSILRKLGSTTRSQAVSVAVREKLV